MTANDWHGVILPRHVSETLEAVARAIQATVHDPAAPPARMLLWGKPGVGKTEIMRAFTRRLGGGGIFVASTDLRAPFIGQTSMAVKNLFARARAQSPALLLIDAFDCSFPGSGPEMDLERRIEFLTELDGLPRLSAVNIIGEAHDARKVDPAILSRDFRLVEIPLPDEEIREAFLRRELQQHSSRLAPGVDDACPELARLLEGKTCRELRILLERAFRGAAERAMEAGGGAEGMVLTRDLLFDDEMVASAKTQFRSRPVTDEPVEAPDPVSALGLPSDVNDDVRRHLKMLAANETLVQHGITVPKDWVIIGHEPSAAAVARLLAYGARLPLLEWDGDGLLEAERERAGRVKALLTKVSGEAPCALLVRNIDRLTAPRSSPNYDQSMGRAVEQLLIYTLRRSDRLTLLLATTSRPDAVDLAVMSHLSMHLVLPDAVSAQMIET